MWNSTQKRENSTQKSENSTQKGGNSTQKGGNRTQNKTTHFSVFRKILKEWHTKR